MQTEEAEVNDCFVSTWRITSSTYTLCPRTYEGDLVVFWMMRLDVVMVVRCGVGTGSLPRALMSVEGYAAVHVFYSQL